MHLAIVRKLRDVVSAKCPGCLSGRAPHRHVQRGFSPKHIIVSLSGGSRCRSSINEKSFLLLPSFGRSGDISSCQLAFAGRRQRSDSFGGASKRRMEVTTAQVMPCLSYQGRIRKQGHRSSRFDRISTSHVHWSLGAI